MTIIIILAILIIALLTFWLRSLGGEVDKYFYKAVQAWLMHNDENARVAAIAAAKTASQEKQKDYCQKLQFVRFVLHTEPKKDEFIKTATKIKELIEEIRSKTWTLKDARGQRDTLYNLNKEYASALDKFDSRVFETHYQSLRSGRNKKSHIELVEALTGENFEEV